MKLDRPVTKTWRTICVVSSWAVAILSFFLTLFRACTQSIAHDEAINYLWHLKGGHWNLLTYSATNHVLFTLIAKVFVHLFGVAEISMRLASLIGAAIYLLFSHLLARRLFGDGPLLPVTTALLCLNPTVMDFLVAARGYGLGLGFLLVAIYLIAGLNQPAIADRHSSRWQWSLILSGVALALSAASNLTNFVPALALGFSLLLLVGEVVPVETQREALGSFGKYFAFPGIFAFLSIMWPYLIQMGRSQFYIGHERAPAALQDFFNSSFLFRWTNDYPASLHAAPIGGWQAIVSDFGSFVILPSLFLIVVVAATISMLRAQSRELTRSKSLFETRIVALTLVSSLIGIAGLHLIGIKYLLSRTVLYLIPLLTISLLLIIKRLPSRGFITLLKPIGLVIGIAVILVYLASIQLTYFRYNAYDQYSREMFFSVMNDIQARCLQQARIGGSWLYQPEIDFYSAKYKVNQIGSYDIVDSSYAFQTPNHLRPAEYDYFVFTPNNVPALEDRNSRVIFHSEKLKTTIIAIDAPQVPRHDCRFQ